MLGPVVRPLELPRTSKSIVFVAIILRPPNKQSIDLRIGAGISVVSTFLIEHNALLMISEIKVMPSHMIFQYFHSDRSVQLCSFIQKQKRPMNVLISYSLQHFSYYNCFKITSV